MGLFLTPASLTHAIRRLPSIPARSVSSTFRPPTLPFSSPPPARRRFEYAAPEPIAANKPDARTSRFKTIDRRPTNAEIPFDYVFVVEPETNKRSPTKQRLKDLLETLRGRRPARVVELVASHPDPIVRVTARNEVEARYREMRRAIRKGAKVSEEPKEVQLTWGVAKADLEHKLRKAKRDLEKGYRVLVVVLMKRGHRPSSSEELVAFADEISQTLSEVGEEWKEREFSNRSMVLSFRGSEGTS